MNLFRCGCQLDGRYCHVHAHWRCHDNFDCAAKTHPEQGDCPVCFLARLRSVSLSAKATPTRGGRP